MAEWLKAPVLKTGEQQCFVGSNPTLSAISIQEKQMSKDCGCGRSPDGKCCGWHNLTNEQYDAKKKEYENKQLNESAPQLLKG